jgi:nitrate/TMAO reductase-like tetraheme cytochrome c subunit
MIPKSADGPSGAAKRTGWFKRWLIRLIVVGAVLLVVFSALIGVAEHKTSQAQFCSSCHVMEPYYDTWASDVHGSSRLNVACVECHYAPGERTTIKAKFRGLSQVTSYFSGRYGAGRPRAHVSNLSCLTAQCHGDLRFMDKPLLLGNVKFVHAKHLQRDAQREEPFVQRLAELEKALRTLVGEQRFGELDAVASEVGAGQERYDKLAALCRQWNVSANRDTLVEFSQLRHRKLRIAQLNDLQCTNCHAYQATDPSTTPGKAGHHFQVSTTTCYTCHFNNEAFNTGTSKCLTCHTPPQQEITVHAEMKLRPGGESEGQTTGTKLVKMNHAEIMAKNVSCAACHADAIQQDTPVTRRDCERCHDQPRFFAEWKEPFTLDLVQKYHRVHIEDQRAKCLDCHKQIQHRLVRGSGEFLASALADCARCHPNHHAAQVDLLLGRGGAAVPKSTPNLMFGSRTNCTGCHTDIQDKPHGNVRIATEQSCIACHGDRHKDTFEKWKLGLELAKGDAEQAFNNAKKALEEAKAAKEDARKQASELLAGAEADLRLVQTGNGLHNVAYAIELLDAVTSRCRQAIELLATQ